MIYGFVFGNRKAVIRYCTLYFKQNHQKCLTSNFDTELKFKEAFFQLLLSFSSMKEKIIKRI